MILLPAAGEWGRRFWLLDLFNHFRVQAAWASAVLAVILFRSGWGIESVAAAASAVFCAVSVWRRAAGPRASGLGSAADGRERTLSVLTCNVWMMNRGYAGLTAVIRAKDPDVIVLLETDQRWYSEMRRSLTHYQHHKAEIREDFFGVAVFSKYPMAATVEHLHEEAKPSLRCRVYHPSGDVALWGMHPEPPYLPAAWVRHRRELEQVVSRVREERLPAVVTGDLNTAPWGCSFRDHLSVLEDSAQGRGLATTWPSPLPRPLRIPIDHLLHTDHFVTASYEVLPGVGSDHRPIFVRLVRRDALASLPVPGSKSAEPKD
jgi:endonuclease/exonuclease/phosphatase (EEP) superfamily protein YafD